ncbi:hypothetical protein [Actinoplanes sp. NPDC051494]|uniref:hypothetical protein n=1 Tax=Actinoplanes sp. NPDC051494 TaxID=3363907 RepID=UPI003789DF16
MDDPMTRPETVARRLGRRAAEIQETLNASGAGDPPPGPERATVDVLTDAFRAWDPEGSRLETVDPSEPALGLPIGGDLDRHRYSGGIWFVAGTLPSPAAAQMLLVRPNETMVALSRRASPEHIAEAVIQLRDPVAAWTQPGSGAAFPAGWSGHRFAERSDYLRHPPRWNVTPTGPPLIDMSMATVLTLHEPVVNPFVFEEWMTFLGTVPEQATPASLRNTFTLRLTEAWAWAAVDALIDSIGAMAARFEEEPGIGGQIHERHRTASARWGSPRERALRPLRERLDVLVAGVEEQDTLLIDTDPRLRVELLPAYHPVGGPPARSRVTRHRNGIQMEIEVDVTAGPAEIEAEVRNCFALARADTSPFQFRSPSDLLRLAAPADDHAALTRLAGLDNRLTQVAAFADWVLAVRNGQDPGL